MASHRILPLIRFEFHNRKFFGLNADDQKSMSFNDLASLAREAEEEEEEEGDAEVAASALTCRWITAPAATISWA